MFNIVGIVARPDRKRALEFGVKLLNYLEEKGLKVTVLFYEDQNKVGNNSEAKKK